MVKRVRRVVGSEARARRRVRSGVLPRSSTRNGRSFLSLAGGESGGGGLDERLRRKASDGRSGLL